MHIILASIRDITTHLHTHPQGIVRTMCMQPVQGYKNVECLAPEPFMVYGHKKFTHPNDPRCKTTWRYADPLTNEQYIEIYIKITTVRMKKVQSWYSKLYAEGTLILCCYCKEGEFCHRTLLPELFAVLNEAAGVRHTWELR